MTSRRMFIGSIFTALAAAPLLVPAQTCCAANSKEKTCSTSNLKATGAIVVAVNGAKTKIKIKCARCGYKTDEIEIDTPTADKPYTQEWKCPKCGHKQTVKVEVPKAE